MPHIEFTLACSFRTLKHARLAEMQEILMARHTVPAAHRASLAKTANLTSFTYTKTAGVTSRKISPGNVMRIIGKRAIAR
jgi:hypothetical protein